MTSKFKTSIILICSMFLGGILTAFIGFSKGKDIAISLTEPRNGGFWETPSEMISACTYILVILGVSFIILAITFSTVLFINWTKKTL